MTQLNKVFQAGVALFNYRTKDSNGFVTTANLINVFERYKNQYQNYSEYEKFDMWSSILQKWFISYLRKLVKPRGNMSQRKVIIKFDDMYQFAYDDLVKNLRYIISLIKKSKYALIRGDVAYDYLLDIYRYYQQFITDINQQVRFARNDGGKILTKVINPVPLRYHPWIESRYFETPDHPYKITLPYNPLIHRYHPGYNILDD